MGDPSEYQRRTIRSRDHHFRGSLGRFATGVAIVTFEGTTRHGITVNSFTSVSMEPPLVLASIARTARSHDELANRPFTVNILGAEQQSLAMHFAGRPQAHEPLWIEGQVAPRLANVLAFFECTPWAAYDGGDHTLYLGEVVDFSYRSGDALAFANSRFTTIPESQLGVEDLL
ncbi:flavin reductase family protein [Psychromicrobium lacuslunae]|uniref:Flavin oxidoreductase n=1 Tax=Psychromicrobium lacuslunae TaxID=1618207 RepID=A0A0D4BYB9_9MICC|nr:flavin reductase family protein [Psychromicrobium lacuslunae]AJT41314.1 flavin oxidoreductase [Psychromicrobium lacuslunae]